MGFVYTFGWHLLGRGRCREGAGVDVFVLYVSARLFFSFEGGSMEVGEFEDILMAVCTPHSRSNAVTYSHCEDSGLLIAEV